ncbi:carbohydrate ABC transporter permease [Streptomyces rugosispiralis]|uniref:Carbohydrate ABC transporter permease n=1 Tax=Streptomyces rugosispiralis TaxID=2967341 RepID=A0ABT1UYP3_9ACTN|nr:carbohydrate ABC transporter permease [Streptomyces rugosispiralis]MCQ8190253.1 carbohydrate ABC transporter permease [Streptomyces rugosispiralis]
MTTTTQPAGTSTRPSATVPRAAAPGRRAARALLYIVLVIGVVAMLYPLVWLLSASLKPADEIFGSAGLLPDTWNVANYENGWISADGSTFGRPLLNSILVSLGAVTGNILACSLAAFAFARLEFPFKRTAFALMMVTVMLPAQVTIIPQYILFNNLGWVDTYLPLVLPKFFAVDAFFIFLMVQFIRGIPRDLDDAAALDGCSPGGIYLKVILPLLRPALVTTAIFTFLWTYNDFFSQLIYISKAQLYTVPLALRQFIDGTGQSDYGPMFAMSVLSLLPTLVLFLIFQRLIVDGISTSGMKG